MSELPGASQQGINDDATIGFDTDGRVLSVSGPAAAALGYTRPEDLEGITLASLVGNDTAMVLIDRLRAAEELENFESETEEAVQQNGSVTFVKHDGTRITLNAVVTPETSGGWITLLDPASGGEARPSAATPAIQHQIDIAATLRDLADRTGPSDSVLDICKLFASELRAATGVTSITIARSTSIAGIYETMLIAKAEGTSTSAGATDLPPSLLPHRGSGPVTVESLDALALFEPVVVAGDEVNGAFVAARADATDSVHLLMIATGPGGTEWPESTVLLIETGVLTLAGTMHATELSQKLASFSRAQETVRQIGMLASQDHDGGFLEAARRVIARRLPVASISIHAADPVTSRCYVAAASGTSESGALAPGSQWQLAGSIEQRVLKTGVPLVISATSADRIAVPPATIAHWRASGLQTVAALPLREGGEVIAVMMTGFSSAITDPATVIRLLESIIPAVHLGVGLSATRTSVLPEPDETEPDPGFVSPKVLLALTRAATESPDVRTLFASVTEWLAEVVPSARVAWGTIDHAAQAYNRLYNYDTTSAGLPDEATVSIPDAEYQSLDIPGLQLPEPGHRAHGSSGSVRAAVKADGRVLATVTMWQQAGEPYTSVELARLERVCEFVAGPLNRLLETESVRQAQRRRELVERVGMQAAEFHEPTQALRALKADVSQLIPHDRALLIEVESLDRVMFVRYDSTVPPTESQPIMFSLDSFPDPDITDRSEPGTISLGGVFSRSSLSASEPFPVFAEYASMLVLPIDSIDGPYSALLLLRESYDDFTEEQLHIARLLSKQFGSARARWDAYRATRDSMHQLQDVQKQLSLILDSVPIALIVTDADGICTRLDGHGLETLGIKREDVLGKSVFELTSRLPDLEETIRQALDGIPATTTTSRGTHSAEVWARPFTEIDGSVKGVTIVGYDVSERLRSKRVVAEARKMQRTLKDSSRIARTVSHELRAPLTTIVAYSDIISAGQSGNLTKEQAHALSMIEKSASQMGALIADLSGLDSGDYEIEKSPVDLGAMMRGIVDSHLPVFKLRKQTLSLTLPEIDCSVEVDELRLTQVITNLLSNASKYSPKEATVSIEVSTSDDELRICVTDNGPGIPADQLERVWDPGIRIPNSITRSVPGSGLGLSIARKIVAQHGGEAFIDSEIGLGTTVTVVLPVHQSEIADDGSDEREIEPANIRPKREAVASATARPEAGQRARRRRHA